MKIKFPHFKQNKFHSCGPASLRMYFRFLGKNFSEKYLEGITNASPNKGTDHIHMINSTRKLGFHCYIKNNSGIKDIIHLIKNRIPVIVNYTSIDDYGHYSVIIGYTKNNFLFNDSDYGEEYNLNIKKFKKMWISGDKKNKKWLMIISNRNINKKILKLKGGKVYHPLR